MINRVRLGLCVCVLALGVFCLWLAQDQIALAAEMVQQSDGQFDSTSLLRLDPAYALAGEDLFAPDEQGASMDDAQAPNANSTDFLSNPTAAASLTGSAAAVPPAQPGPATADSTGATPGWPKTTAETTLADISANPASSGHWVDVNISRQQVTAYDGSTPIKTVLVSTGTRRHPTVVGTFHVWLMLRSTTMSGGSYARGDHYHLRGVPNVMYFYRGYALHGTYWHHNFGHPMSHGCVNLTIDDSAWFYEFGFMGMTVRTHY